MAHEVPNRRSGTAPSSTGTGIPPTPAIRTGNGPASGRRSLLSSKPLIPTMDLTVQQAVARSGEESTNKSASFDFAADLYHLTQWVTLRPRHPVPGSSTRGTSSHRQHVWRETHEFRDTLDGAGRIQHYPTCGRIGHPLLKV